MRRRTADIAGIVVEPQGQESGVTSGKPVQIEVAARLPALLDLAVERIIAGMREIGGIIDISDSRTAPGIDWRIEVDRAEAARCGADVTMVGSAIQLVTHGIMIGDYRPNDADDEVDIRVLFPDADRNITELVVSNNIVLIDTYNIMRRRSLPVLDAILLTCSQRLRPVMLTTVTTILGRLPIVFGLNVDVIGRTVEVDGPSSQW